MRKTLCLLPLASALLLSGCISLAPEYERPEAPVEQVWPQDEAMKNAALLIFAGKLRAFFAIAVWVGMLLVPVIYYGLAAYILLAGWVRRSIRLSRLAHSTT